MKLINIPIGKCFSFTGMKGSYYREMNGTSIHKYDVDGNYVMYSSTLIDNISSILKHNKYFVSDIKGNKL